MRKFICIQQLCHYRDDKQNVTAEVWHVTKINMKYDETLTGLLLACCLSQQPDTFWKKNNGQTNQQNPSINNHILHFNNENPHNFPGNIYAMSSVHCFGGNINTYNMPLITIHSFSTLISVHWWGPASFSTQSNPTCICKLYQRLSHLYQVTNIPQRTIHIFYTKLWKPAG